MLRLVLFCQRHCKATTIVEPTAKTTAEMIVETIVETITGTITEKRALRRSPETRRRDLDGAEFALD